MKRILISLLLSLAPLAMTGCFENGSESVDLHVTCPSPVPGVQWLCTVGVGPSASPSPIVMPSPSVTPSETPIAFPSSVVVSTPSSSPTPSPRVSVTPSPVPPVAGYDDPSCRGIMLGGWRRDGSGWTVLPDAKGAGFRAVCVSATQVQDPVCTQVVKTTAEGIALLRKGQPDQLLLHRGETFPAVDTKAFAGQSVDKPMVLGAYGDKNLPRPIVKSGIYLGTWVSNLIVQSIDFQGPGNGSGITIQGKWSNKDAVAIKNVLVEDVRVQHFGEGLSWNPGDPTVMTAENVTLRRSQILDNVTPNKSQGMYAENIRGLTIEENVFDHNGYTTRGAPGGLGGNVFSHNMYLQTENACLIVRGNVSAEAAATGLQQRAGGVMENNFFVRNPLGMTWGVVNGGSVKARHIFPGLTGRIQGNVVYQATDINADPSNARGMAFTIGNSEKLLFKDNLAVGYIPLQTRLDQSKGLSIESDVGIGTHNVKFDNVTLVGFKTGWTHTGRARGSVKVLPNGDVTDMAGTLLLSHEYQAGKWPSEEGSGIPDGITKTVIETGMDPSSVLSQPTLDPSKFVEPTRTLGAYVGQPSLSSDAAFTAFIGTVRGMDKGHWDSRFTGSEVAKYFREGFRRK
jgi:hypothetical protein